MVDARKRAAPWWLREPREVSANPHPEEGTNIMKVPSPGDRPPDEEPTDPITPQPQQSRGPRHRRPTRRSWIRNLGRSPALPATVILLVLTL
jgi:hypothetical protein